jgi:protein PhnA
VILAVSYARLLNISQFSPCPPVMKVILSTVSRRVRSPCGQVLSYRLLRRLGAESWAQDLLDAVYLDDETQVWPDAMDAPAEDHGQRTLDSNGSELFAGDTVVLIKDLDVKGASFVAKRGTAVRGISLANNPEHIEGRVNGTRIVMISAFDKKSN